MRLRMPSRREAVAPTVDHVIDAVTSTRLSPEQRDNLAVALSEALANAAVHGNRLQPDKRVRIAVCVKPDAAEIQVSDSGTGFDHSAVDDPTQPERVLVPGGRGVFLMRQLVDELKYNEAGNRVRLTVRPKAQKKPKR